MPRLLLSAFFGRVRPRQNDVIGGIFFVRGSAVRSCKVLFVLYLVRPYRQKCYTLYIWSNLTRKSVMHLLSTAIGRIMAEHGIIWLAGHPTSVGIAHLAISSRPNHPTFVQLCTSSVSHRYLGTVEKISNSDRYHSDCSGEETFEDTIEGSKVSSWPYLANFFAS